MASSSYQFRDKSHYRARHFFSRAYDKFPAGCLEAALIGVGAGGEAAITPYLLTRYFGLRAFSTLYGLTWTFYAAAGAIGPVILGRTSDVTGSYTSLLTLLAAVLGLAATTNLLLPRYADSITIEVN
jgi:MFS family permease